MSKYIREVLFYIFIITVTYYSTKAYSEYKRKEELMNLISDYYKEKNKEKLFDTLSLCKGLLITNPSKENLETCLEIENKLKN